LLRFSHNCAECRTPYIIMYGVHSDVRKILEPAMKVDLTDRFILSLKR
jgi:hypothetical protein